MNMLKAMAVSALVVMPVSGAALADTQPIKAVEVVTDTGSIANAEAAKFWGNLSNDLKAAILARIQDRVAEEGLTVGVDIDEVSLANTFQTALGVQDSALKGIVKIHDDEGTNFGAYDVSVTIENANLYLKDGVAPATAFTDSPEHYAAMVDAFADTVAKNLP